MKSRRQFRRELDAMTERWLRAEGRNVELRGENELLLAELSRVAAGLRRSCASGGVIVRPVSADAGCGCWTCDEARREVEFQRTGDWYAKLSRFMIVCPLCGNKRCPRATHHDHECTGSNDSGQLGSRYTKLSPAERDAALDRFHDSIRPRRFTTGYSQGAS